MLLTLKFVLRRLDALFSTIPAKYSVVVQHTYKQKMKSVRIYQLNVPLMDKDVFNLQSVNHINLNFFVQVIKYSNYLGNIATSGSKSCNWISN